MLKGAETLFKLATKAFAVKTTMCNEKALIHVITRSVVILWLSFMCNGIFFGLKKVQYSSLILQQVDSHCLDLDLNN